MTFADWVLIFTTLMAPLLAVQTQKLLERKRDDGNKKLWIYKTLMSTRAAGVSPAHVQALNSIDLEFQGKAYEVVRTAWKILLDHLGSYPTEDNVVRGPAWEEKRGDLLAQLLLQMGRTLGYNFDEVHIKKGIYSPVAHSRIENENQLVREGVISLLQGERPLKMDVVGFPVAPQAAVEGEKIRKGLIDMLDGKNALKGGV
ncbi:MAG: hypothetical protein PSV40_06910 [Polaromonas sp.]|uniref:DUF6680 family protein n=1 Tax=Polaromonas sp. TaxID=1869339 RepID=UPI00248895E0|nr:DUF6680 family protein [Polaromonas sp.]MDI1268816.1 hypothetical protein [Polaromonas sp.]